ncbi:MAG: VTT domain-containing protein [Chloroflexota bacterium]
MDRTEILKRWLIPLLTLLLIIVISVSIFLFRGKLSELRGYGYLGAFLVSLATNATIILPVGNFLILSVFGAVLPSATLVGLAGGTGAAIGELTGYMAGYSGRTIMKQDRSSDRMRRWLRRWGTITIFTLSLLPFFFDLAGITAGAIRFPLWKFLLLCWLGRSLLYIGIAFASAWGFRWFLPYLG